MPPDQPQEPQPDFSTIRPEPVPGPDTPAISRAQEENDFFSKDKRARDHKREQRTKSVLNYVLNGIIIVSGFLLGVAIFIRVLHLVFPERWNWLSTHQIDALDNLAKYAGSGALGVALTNHLSKNIE